MRARLLLEWAFPFPMCGERLNNEIVENILGKNPKNVWAALFSSSAPLPNAASR